MSSRGLMLGVAASMSVWALIGSTERAMASDHSGGSVTECLRGTCLDSTAVDSTPARPGNASTTGPSGSGSTSGDRPCGSYPGEWYGFGTYETNFYQSAETGLWYRYLAFVCEGDIKSHGWYVSDPPGEGGEAAASPGEVAQRLVVRVEAELPEPVVRTPADWDANGWAYVQTPTFFWIDDEGGWTPVSATASAGSVSVTTTATPVRLVIDPGDSTGTFECEGKPPAYAVGLPVESFPHECAHTYRNSSRMAPNQEAFDVTTSIVWSISWTATTGASGDLGEVTTTGEPRALPVAEIQAIITG